MDNFSRKIFTWEVADQLRGAIRLNTLRSAWELIRNRNPKPQLICDGGSENHNQTINQFLQSEAERLQYLTAKKEVY